MDHSFVPPSQQPQQRQAQMSSAHSQQWESSGRSYSNWTQPETWQEQDWGDWESASESSRSSSTRRFPHYQKPRQGRRAQHHQQRPQVPAQSKKGKSKGSKGSKGHKGKGKHHIEPPPWSSSAAQPPAPTSATPAQSRAEAKLHEIVSVLKKKDDPELQTLAKEADVLQNKTATSKLHKAVTVHGDAKTAVLEARQARANLHASWKQYLETAITTWRSFLEDFDKEDRRLEELIGKADMNLQAAQNSLDEAKKAATEEELKDQIETIEDEDEGLDRTAKSSQVMREGLKGMLDGLEQLHARTEEICVETGNKRQRVDDGNKSSAMQPFGGAGR